VDVSPRAARRCGADPGLRNACPFRTAECAGPGERVFEAEDIPALFFQRELGVRDEQIRWHRRFGAGLKSRRPPRQEQPCYTEERRVILKHGQVSFVGRRHRAE
jgi:hypothetical protein